MSQVTDQRTIPTLSAFDRSLDNAVVESQQPVAGSLADEELNQAIDKFVTGCEAALDLSIRCVF